ncbi:MAG: hypothetical protein ABGZ35_06960 [Planctomycetaceae bacterium]
MPGPTSLFATCSRSIILIGMMACDLFFLMQHAMVRDSCHRASPDSRLKDIPVTLPFALRPTFHLFIVALLLTHFASAVVALEKPAFHSVECEGDYQHHLQGVCTNAKDAVYWSFTTALIKTDPEGKVLINVPVANHHGDLCFRGGKLYVAVNLGKFNDPLGNADSWVYVYDSDTLALISKHEIQEVFHGAGGIGVMDGGFYVVGGLPDGIQKNYVYQYDAQFHFQNKHIVTSGWTKLGIQTATFHEGTWWFGCYGTPNILLRTDSEFRMLGRYEFPASLGIVGLSDGRLLVAKGPRTKDKRCMGSLHVVRPDSAEGLVFLPEPGPAVKR